ncbi:MAG: methyltransferase domain-containing protein [Actinomycetota bacterium]|nr:methyltransferase domain-containing protein [Actinomycetota bacterium]
MMIKAKNDILVIDSPTTNLDIEIPKASNERLEISLLRVPNTEEESSLLGRWVFSNIEPGAAILSIHWLNSLKEAVEILSGDTLVAPQATSSAKDFIPWPRMLLRLKEGDKVSEIAIKVIGNQLLDKYYTQESHQEEYITEHPFFLSFHNARLRTQTKLFQKFIKPGSRVLDVGSGYSIFHLAQVDWDFDITCCDLDSAAMEKMRLIAPNFSWVVADATKLPWENSSFDAVYAGEIIEHVPDTDEALEEWRRVLAPRGILILSTPNRERLLARANGKAIPVHPEHIREFGMLELQKILEEHGFDVLKITGIYLEALIDWWRPRGNRNDILTTRLAKPKYELLYRLGMWLGKISPSRAFDLVFVTRKL